MEILLGILDFALQIVTYVLIAQVILSWLVAFNVINAHNEPMRGLIRGLERLVEPIYRPIRRVLPDFGGIDFSPLIVILIIIMIRTRILTPLIAKAMQN